MANLNKLIIDGIDYTDYIIEFELMPDYFDGEGAGRLATYGAPLKRDPMGFIVNFNVTFGSMTSNDSKLLSLWNLFKSLGSSREFVSVTIDMNPFGTITQNMYGKPSGFKLKKISRDHKTYWNPLQASFTAEKGV